MFTQRSHVIGALRRYRDHYSPKSASLMLLGRGNDPHAEPFRAGFLSTIEERAELLRRLARLDHRSRRLVIMRHVEALPVAAIARSLDLSRVHCYRLENAALESMLDPATEVEAAAV